MRYRTGVAEAARSETTSVLPGVLGTMSGKKTIHTQTHEIPVICKPVGQSPQTKKKSIPMAPTTSNTRPRSSSCVPATNWLRARKNIPMARAMNPAAQKSGRFGKPPPQMSAKFCVTRLVPYASRYATAYTSAANPRRLPAFSIRSGGSVTFPPVMPPPVDRESRRLMK
jgi:hypothetical protein